ncbi:MAG TPA: hypothetical protein ENG23_02245 [Methanomicrobia archaeon]|nr:hypothetical protein [Methanomicrobia archaeon]
MYKKMQEKVEHSKEIVKNAVRDYRRIAVACSFGKDSMATVLLAREVQPKIPVFSIMTVFKPRATFDYLVRMNEQLGLNVTVFMVAREAEVPAVLKEREEQGELEVRLLSALAERFEEESAEAELVYGKKIYEVAPDRCCELLKVEPAKEAVKDYDAWVCGLRNTEGRTRKDYKEVEFRGLAKVNPILTWTEAEVLGYLAVKGVPLHPWYSRVFPGGKRIRSLGCEPCTVPVYDWQEERAGRWKGTSKCGGECGIHTKRLK